MSSSPRSLAGTWLMIVRLLTPAERRRGLGLGVLLMCNALTETAGVASVLPFLAVLGEPSSIQKYDALRWLFLTLEFESTGRFLLFLGLASLGIVILGGVMRLVTEYWMAHFIELRRHTLGQRVLTRYVRQPYAFFLNRHSAQLSKMILSEVDQVTNAALLPAIRIPAYAFVALTLIGLLVAVDPVVAGVAALVVGTTYGGLYLSVVGAVRRHGEDQRDANRDRFETAAEIFGGIKELKLLGREEAYLQRFHGHSLRFSEHQALIRAVNVVPRYLIEIVGFGGILALAVSLLAVGDDLSHVLSVLGLYTFAAYRLLPTAQHLYASFANLRFGAPAAEALRAELDDLPDISDRVDPDGAPVARAVLHHAVTWRHVTFTYPGTTVPALEDVSLTIPAHQIVAFVGGTGAGKTTAIDLILGLLPPTEGHILIDDDPLEGRRLRAWQRTLGYVPQHIFLADDTIRANIAFGVPAAQVDDAAIARAARLAHLDDFVHAELPRGFDTKVGERGVRLSGGQRQRIGIARALYNDPDVLVFDEATSAVDTRTEQEVMAAIHALAPQKTIILVAHRISTVRKADRIFLLEGGRLVDIGTFDELDGRSARFRELAAGVAR